MEGNLGFLAKIKQRITREAKQSSSSEHVSAENWLLETARKTEESDKKNLRARFVRYSSPVGEAGIYFTIDRQKEPYTIVYVYEYKPEAADVSGIKKPVALNEAIVLREGQNPIQVLQKLNEEGKLTDAWEVHPFGQGNETADIANKYELFKSAKLFENESGVARWRATSPDSNSIIAVLEAEKVPAVI